MIFILICPRKWLHTPLCSVIASLIFIIHMDELYLLSIRQTCSFMYSNLKIFSKNLPESNLMSEKFYEMGVGMVGWGRQQRKPSLL